MVDLELLGSSNSPASASQEVGTPEYTTPPGFLFVFRWKGKDGRVLELNSEPEGILLGCAINLQAGKKELRWREQGDLGPCDGCTCPSCAETWEEELSLQRTKGKTERPAPTGCCLLVFIGPKG